MIQWNRRLPKCSRTKSLYIRNGRWSQRNYTTVTSEAEAYGASSDPYDERLVVLAHAMYVSGIVLIPPRFGVCTYGLEYPCDNHIGHLIDNFTPAPLYNPNVLNYSQTHVETHVNVSKRVQSSGTVLYIVALRLPYHSFPPHVNSRLYMLEWQSWPNLVMIPISF